MATLDEIFKKEFNQSRSSLSSQGNIYDLKLPKGSLPSKDFYTVKNVDAGDRCTKISEITTKV